MRIVGRKVDLTVTLKEKIVRLDKDNDPEFWMEIQLTDEDLKLLTNGPADRRTEEHR